MADLTELSTLFDAGRFSEALALSRQLLTNGVRRSDLDRLHRIAGVAALKSGEALLAIEHLKQSVRLEPASAPLWSDLGLAHEFSGDLDQAEACFRRAISLDKECHAAFFNLLEITQLSSEDRVAQLLEQLIRESTSMTRQSRGLLQFAAGNMFAGQHRYHEAFQSFAAGNDALRPEFDSNEHQRHLDNIKEVFTTDFFRRRGGPGHPSELPVFIVGMPRCGSTLVEQILSSHSSVSGLGELRLIPQIADRLGAVSGKNLPFPQCLPYVDDIHFRGFSQSYLNHIALDSETTSRVVDKQLGNFALLGLVALLFPNSRVIHVRRTPLDTCLSCFFHRLGAGGEFSYSLDDLGRCYVSYHSLMMHWEQTLPLKMITIEYEELVRDQKAVTKRILDFCGLLWDDNCLAFQRSARPVLTASAAQVRKPLYLSSIGRWHPYREYLSPLIEILRAAGLHHGL